MKNLEYRREGHANHVWLVLERQMGSSIRDYAGLNDPSIGIFEIPEPAL